MSFLLYFDCKLICFLWLNIFLIKVLIPKNSHFPLIPCLLYLIWYFGCSLSDQYILSPLNTTNTVRFTKIYPNCSEIQNLSFQVVNFRTIWVNLCKSHKISCRILGLLIWQRIICKAWKLVDPIVRAYEHSHKYRCTIHLHRYTTYIVSAYAW